MNGWVQRAERLLAAGEAAVLVTVAGVRGSAPREIGATMLVTTRETIGTIGGGQLEYQSARLACRALRSGGDPALWLRRFPLGADCGQCCGGVVDILFEDLSAAADRIDALSRALIDDGRALLITTADAGGRLTRVAAAEALALRTDDPELDDVASRCLGDGKARRLVRTGGGFRLIEPLVASDFEIAVFGAGHVGSAAVAILATLDTRIRWIDSRPGLLPERVPANVQTLLSDDPAREVAALPAGSWLLVMTHSHALDYDVCSAALSRDEFAYLGLIGSRSKRRRFERRLRQQGLTGLDRLTCPIGISGITGKRPAEIAVAVAAELLELRAAAGHGAATRRFRSVTGRAG